jgi:hypothetical protein
VNRVRDRRARFEKGMNAPVTSAFARAFDALCRRIPQ